MVFWEVRVSRALGYRVIGLVLFLNFFMRIPNEHVYRACLYVFFCCLLFVADMFIALGTWPVGKWDSCMMRRNEV